MFSFIKIGTVTYFLVFKSMGSMGEYKGRVLIIK